jgi:hypothetical protein
VSGHLFLDGSDSLVRLCGDHAFAHQVMYLDFHGWSPVSEEALNNSIQELSEHEK